MKRIWALLLLLCMLPAAGLCQQAVFNRTDNLTEEFVFPEDTPVLEIVFPRVTPPTVPSSALGMKP